MVVAVELTTQERVDRLEELRAERMAWELRGGHPAGYIRGLGDPLVRFDGQPRFGCRRDG